ncbi:MAG: LpxI family protein [Rhizobiaceae bacterium]
MKLKAHQDPYDLAIICGYGLLPVEIAQGSIKAGRNPYLIGIEGEADSNITGFPHEIMAWGQIGKLFKLLKRLDISQVVFAGGIRKRPDLLKLKLDLVAIMSLPRVLTFMLGGDNTVLSGTIKLFENRGIEIVGPHQIAPQLLAQKGSIAGRKPSGRGLQTIQLGFSACKALGSFDIGQASVAEAGRVVALEGVEGTDAMLERIVSMRQIGKMPMEGQHGVLVKTMKPGQDMRVDLPAIGPDTIEGVIRAGLKGIALEAERSIILQRETTIAAARKHGIFIYGLSTDEGLIDG